MSPSPMCAYIVHGYEATPGANWFPWLAEQLENKGTRTTVVRLPAPDEPQADAWLATLRETVGVPDEGTALIAHSLGCVAVLRHLTGIQESWSARSLTLVSGFVRPLANLPQLRPFTAPELTTDDLAAIGRRIPRRTVIRSDDDTTVDPTETTYLADALGARLVTVPGAGHFVHDGGWTTHPAALDAI